MAISLNLLCNLALQNVTTLNSDCQLPVEPINMKPTPVTAARLEVFEEVPTSKLPELPEAPNQKNYAVSN